MAYVCWGGVAGWGLGGRAQAATFERNVVADGGQGGFWTQDAARCVLRNNRVYNNLKTAMQARPPPPRSASRLARPCTPAAHDARPLRAVRATR